MITPAQIRDFISNRFSLVERRTNIYQLIAQFYHEDGDMVDIYIVILDEKIRICDLGKTLMKLSCSYEIDTPDNENMFKRIILRRNINEDNGNLYIDVENINHIAYATKALTNAIIEIYSHQNISTS